ncbi:MAG: Cytochrome C [Actinobacteria bacterium]|nr:Cytochrome C [Actinomycetota bacterium]
MKKILFLFLVASLACGATLLYAKEDHKAYRDQKIAECTECHRGADVTPNHLAAWNEQHRRGIDAGLHIANDRGPNYKPRTHRSSFKETHPIAAFDNPNSCQRCHPASYCSECHARFQPQDLMFQSHRKGWSDRPAVSGGPAHSTFPADSCLTCHPSSVLPANKWAGSHAREARRNLATCQACHSDGATCLKCHSAKSGLRVNPHPDNWGSIKGKLNKAAGQRTCVKCH